MSNPTQEYNDYIRANLPYWITYDEDRARYVTWNGKYFPTYLEAKWYSDYIIKFGAALPPPLFLFANGEQGALYDPSDLTTLYQDAAGTTPATADGDPVGYMADKSGNGNHATQSTAAARPVYRTDGTLHWLEFDGVDDFLEVATPAFRIDKSSTLIAGEIVTEGRWASFAPASGRDSTRPDGALIAGERGDSTRSIGYFINGESAILDVGVGSELSVYEAISDEPNMIVRKNGNNEVVSGGVTVYSVHSGNFYIGAGFDIFDGGVEEFADLKLYGLLTVEGVKNESQLTQLRKYFSSKSGVTL